MIDKEAEPTLHYVMTILGSLKTWLTVAEEWAHLISPLADMASTEDGQPLSSRRKTTSAISDDQDVLGGMEEQLKDWIVKHLRRALNSLLLHHR